MRNPALAMVKRGYRAAARRSWTSAHRSAGERCAVPSTARRRPADRRLGARAPRRLRLRSGRGRPNRPLAGGSRVHGQPRCPWLRQRPGSTRGDAGTHRRPGARGHQSRSRAQGRRPRGRAPPGALRLRRCRRRTARWAGHAVDRALPHRHVAAAFAGAPPGGADHRGPRAADQRGAGPCRARRCCHPRPGRVGAAARAAGRGLCERAGDLGASPHLHRSHRSRHAAVRTAVSGHVGRQCAVYRLGPRLRPRRRSSWMAGSSTVVGSNATATFVETPSWPPPAGSPSGSRRRGCAGIPMGYAAKCARSSPRVRQRTQRGNLPERAGIVVRRALGSAACRGRWRTTITRGTAR